MSVLMTIIIHYVSTRADCFMCRELSPFFIDINYPDAENIVKDINGI
jgi:hypothetical protein